MLRRRLVSTALLVALLFTLTATIALAQDGTGDKVVVGQNYVLSSGEVLGGDLTVLGGEARLEDDSVVRGDVAVLGGRLTVSGDIIGDMTVVGGEVRLTSSAVLEGSLSTLGGQVSRDEGAVVRGDVMEGSIPLPFRQMPLPYGLDTPEAPRFRDGPETFSAGRDPLGAIWDFLRWQISTVAWGLLTALLGIVVLLVAPKPLARVTAAVGSQPALNLAIGLLTAVVAALLGTLLLIACGLGLLVWLAAGIAMVFGWIAVGFWVGRRLTQLLRLSQGSSLWEVALGVFIITALSRVPFCLGFLIGLIGGSIGLGAVVLTRFGTQSPDGVQRLPARSSATIVPEAGSEGPSGPIPTEPPVSTSDFETGPTEGLGLPGRGQDLEAIAGIGPSDAERLRAAGITSLQRLVMFEPETLGPRIGVDPERIRREDWIGQANHLLAGE